VNNRIGHKERAIKALPLPYLIATAECLGFVVKPLDGEYEVYDTLNGASMPHLMSESTLRELTAVRLLRTNRLSQVRETR
jgi:hypothetical protein